VLATRPLTQEDLILTLADGATGPYDLDRIRLMKGCFIVSERGRREWRNLFEFRPYAYGPFDRSVYSARDAAIADGLLMNDPHGRYDDYALTDSGRARVAEVEAAIGGANADWVRRVGHYVTSKSFAQLLREVYARWPDYASRSVFTG
jgi:hypothetical protein